MKSIRKAVAALLGAVFACALGVAQAHAQSAPLGCVTTKPGFPVSDMRMFRTALPWHEVEGAWRGEWTLAGSIDDWQPNRSVLYNGVWRNGGARVDAEVTISISGNRVGLVRHQREGDCVYEGTLTTDWRVSGTYTCSFNARAGALPWSAMIGNGQAPIPCSTTHAADPRLNARWLEHEGDWTGRWTPRGGNGDYDGAWTHVTEGVHAGLQITITGNNVEILRTQPQGLCHYHGSFGPGGWTASGFYDCQWDHQRHQWNATIGAGHP